MSQNAFHVALVVIEIHIAYSHSLKDKRMALRGLKDTLKRQFNVSVTEVGYLDNWQRSQIVCSAVATEKKLIHQLHARIEKHVLETVDGELVYCDLEWL